MNTVLRLPLLLVLALQGFTGCTHHPQRLLGTWHSDVAHSMSWNDRHAKLSQLEEAQYIELLGNMLVTYNPDGTATIEMKPHTLTYSGRKVVQPGYRRTVKYKILAADETSMLVQFNMPGMEDIVNKITFVGNNNYWIKLGKAKANSNPREYFRRIVPVSPIPYYP